MSQKDARMLQIVGAAIVLACLIDGAQTGRWKTAHTVGTVLGLIGTIGPAL